MKYLSCIALLLLINCGRPTETTAVEDTTQVADDPMESTPGNEQLERFLSDFEVAKDGYPFVGFSRTTEVGNYHVEYFFEDDNLVWMSRKMSEEGGIAENFLVNRDPEGTFYLHYGMGIDGGFGYVGSEPAEWNLVKADGSYKPYIAGVGQEDKFDWETEFEETMNIVRNNRDHFNLNNGKYEYDHKQGLDLRNFEFSEVLYNSNLLSPTRFNPDMIQGYLNWWYPLYEDASGNFYRHQLCTGGEDYIKITVEAGNYRWEEELSGSTIVYTVKGFEESEGDAFYATIERNGNRLKKTLIKSEYEGNPDRLSIDGRVYTSEPKKYDIVAVKCD